MKLDDEAKSNILAQLYIEQPAAEGQIKFITVDGDGEIWAWSAKPEYDFENYMWFVDGDGWRGWYCQDTDKTPLLANNLIFEVE